MAPRRQGWVDWKKTKAKKILIEDLENDVLPLSADDMSAIDCWKIYKQYPEFRGIQFDQFEERLADHRAAIERQKNVSYYDEESFLRDRMLRPVKPTNQRGEPKFYLSPAYDLLKEHIKEKKHKRLSPLTLWYGFEPYQAFDKSKFRQRIYQEERKQKFIFQLELKRAEKKKKYKLAKRNAGLEDSDSEEE